MDPVKLPGILSNTIPASLQVPPANQVGRSGIEDIESFEPHNQAPAIVLEEVAPEQDLVDDDDIQLVLSVPRRRKKKRKGFDNTICPGTSH